ncbi:PREDICTED: uncharacterized protein LOC109209850 [Nicotiana attenuata]|uniref:Uncharacterized protein n=1 Tax=Nicotiana attenuata TaxID=49451 RepID=A0A1J6JH17_NICAT|nr:PREDICTED: uncharacterized protein LOC109209850 [Nicotiana attenuata]OIT06265.1 hypothetical protein A4A49_03841 [Nicotiana attenuata]
MISNFEADVKFLQNPSLISQFFSLSAIEKVPQVYSFCKWGALVLAIVASFSSLIRKSKLLFFYVRKIKPSTEPLLQYLSENINFSDDDDDDECSSVSSNDEELTQVDEDFSVAGSSFYFKEQGQQSNLRLGRRRSSYEWFPLTEFSAGKSVVKFWDSLTLGLDFNDSFNISDFTVLSSEVRDAKTGVVLAGYDTRMRRQSPAICAEWGTGKVLGISGNGVGKVYVRDEVAGVLTVGDLRNVKTPVETVTELEGAVNIDE